MFTVAMTMDAGPTFLGQEACPGCGSLHAANGESYGVAWGDVDGNDLPDLYINHHDAPGEPAALYLNLGDPNGFEKIVVDAEVGDQHHVIFADVDQDGDQDLFELQGGSRAQANPDDPLSTFNINQLYLNDGDGLEFQNVAFEWGLGYAPGRGRSPNFVNLDGELALFVGTTVREDGQFPGALFVRGRDGDYTEDGARLEVDLQRAKGAVFGHLGGEDDTRADLILTYGFGRFSILEREDEGYVATEFAVDRVSDMVLFDADGDLDFEIFVAEGAREQRVADKMFDYDEATDSWVDVSDQAGLGQIISASSSVAVGDFDNDMDLDVVTYLNEFEDNGGRPKQTENNGLSYVLWMNDGDGVFTAIRRDDFENKGVAGSVTVVDYNLDGALDLFFSDGFHEIDAGLASGNYTLLTGDAPSNNWLQVDLEGVVSERDGLGARVYVVAGGVEQVQGQYGARLMAQDHARLHFGLGQNDEASVRVVWADGFEQTIGSVSANQLLTVVEDRPIADAEIWNRYADIDSARPGASAPGGLFEEILAHAAFGPPATLSANRVTFDGPDGQTLRLNGEFEIVDGAVASGAIHTAILIHDGRWVGAARDLVWDYGYLLEAAADPAAGARFLDRTPVDYQGTSIGETITGGATADDLRGALGADTFIASLGADRIKGAGGTDTLSFQTDIAANGVTANLASQTAEIVGGGGVVTVLGVENLQGGDGEDVLVGDGKDNVLVGWGARDRLDGAGGDDTLRGRAGDDALKGKAGDDLIVGGRGGDFLAGGGGADAFLFFGAEGADDVFDKIADFTPGVDQIRLRDFDQAQLTTEQRGDVGVLLYQELEIRLPGVEVAALDFGTDIIFI